MSRAAALFAGATLSSRSKMIASASLSSALAIFFSLSAGTNSQLRGSAIGLLQEQRRARAFAHQLVALVEASVRPGDDARIGTRLAFTNSDAFRFAAKGVASEDGIREFEGVVAEVRDECSERRVGDADADHQAEGENRIDQRLAEFGVGRRCMVEVHRLRIVSQRRDEDIVRL